MRTIVIVSVCLCLLIARLAIAFYIFAITKMATTRASLGSSLTSCCHIDGTTGSGVVYENASELQTSNRRGSPPLRGTSLINEGLPRERLST